ncbi:FecR family protein [Sphingobacterium faecium]|uniref:FecR family protein n=1 Tax=Sphingobacterium faecium TaxID=34087 RepID=UPI002468D160|nr:FecR family protein [Sphingobacterium faecium]MDH5825298.1 FecR family protein [Sphingobacterium faecium]
MMESKPFIIAAIIKKSLVEKPSDEEKVLLENWRNSNAENSKLYDSFKDGKSIRDDLNLFKRIDVAAAWDNLEKKESHILPFKSKFNLKIWVPLIASCLVVCFYLLYLNQYISRSHSKIITIHSQVHKNDVKPASQEAVLILDNGDQLDLTKAKSEFISNNIKLKDEQLAYEKGVGTGELEYNTLVVPKGGYYKIELSDGSKVWVNAMSKLKFPVLFAAGERSVELEGEAFFEVTKDVNRPFIVRANGTDIKVLGTHFNVDAYSHKVRTTLQEGKVEVASANQSILLAPGEFSESANGILEKGTADLNRDLAWYNNEFYFKKDNIKFIVDQLSNWYDLEVRFEHDVNKNKIVTGSIDRNVPLSQVIEMLEYVSDLKFKIDGNQLIIRNK